MAGKEPQDATTREMVARLNGVDVSKDELIEVVTEGARLPPGHRDLTGHAIIAVRLHPRDPERVKAIVLRLEALARLLEEEGAPGWALPSRDGGVLVQEPVFAAAAVQPLIDRGRDLAFDREPFLRKVLELADLDQIA